MGTDGEVMDYAEQACDLLPAYADQCKAAIEMYGPQMIKMVEDNLKPNVICASVGLCDKSADWRLPESCAQPAQAGFCRALMPSYYFNTIRACAKSSITADAVAIPIDSKRSSSVKIDAKMLLAWASAKIASSPSTT